MLPALFEKETRCLPIKRDTTTLRLVIHVFPRFGLLQFACFNCEF